MISRSAGAAAAELGPIHAVPLNVDACYVCMLALSLGFCVAGIID